LTLWVRQGGGDTCKAKNVNGDFFIAGMLAFIRLSIALSS
jgi:hypothetical protein